MYHNNYFTSRLINQKNRFIKIEMTFTNEGKLFHSLANFKIQSHILASCITNFTCEFSVKICFRNFCLTEILKDAEAYRL